jgi:putative PIN family toxin of toxin-antitoxin system
MRKVIDTGQRVPIVYTVHACRDPKDNMILEAAVNGQADIIVTGDKDLVVFGNFRRFR